MLTSVKSHCHACYMNRFGNMPVTVVTKFLCMPVYVNVAYIDVDNCWHFCVRYDVCYHSAPKQISFNTFNTSVLLTNQQFFMSNLNLFYILVVFFP